MLTILYFLVLQFAALPVFAVLYEGYFLQEGADWKCDGIEVLILLIAFLMAGGERC